MCGICGVMHFDPARIVEQPQLLAMRDSMAYRGPDDAGHYVDGNLGLGSRRLSIIDLSERGHMPMFSADERYVIVYNGEIYNFKELRASLEDKGGTFRSKTDTEVILALFAELGPEMLDRLNGMFAIAIWDRNEKTLFLARDRSGIKPLYYALWGDSLFFGSEIKSLLSAGVPLELDHSIWGELLMFRFLSGTKTPYCHIKELLPGHFLTARDKNINLRRWWNLAERVLDQRQGLPRNPVDWYRQTFDESVEMQRISDVPLGVLLSGGLDSSSLAASLAAQGNSGLNSFTVRFQEKFYDEGLLAQELAEQWHLKFNDLFLTPQEISALLCEAAWLNDEPLAHGNEVHILAISRLAKPLVTVLLSGEGADETLGGYVRYRPLLYGHWLERGTPLINRLDQIFGWQGRWHKLARFLRMDSLDAFILYNSCDVLPSDLELIGIPVNPELEYRRQVLEEAKQIYPDEPVRQLMYLDLHTFLVSELDRIDRMTMGASIEARVPFLDHRLIEVNAALPLQAHFQFGLGKQLARKAFRERLPQSILKNRKWGFGVPWNHYYREFPQFREIVADLDKQQPLVDSPLDRKKIRQLTEQFLRGDDSGNALVHQLFMISVWWQGVRNHHGAFDKHPG
jgi:asparagine synthase (glutamine-hydrolysing)